MDLDQLAEILAFFFTDHSFNGDPVELWKAIIDLAQLILSKLGDFFG